MLDGAYRKRLADDLPKWRDAGWVTPDGAAAILASVDGASRPAFGLAALVGTIGGLLLGLGVIAFIGANWDEVPRIYRFGLLVGGLALAYLMAGLFDRRDLRVFSEAALLVAGLVFAAAIALIGQSYHLSGEFADAVLLWIVGIFAAALMTGSPTLTVLGMIGGAYWTWLATFDLGASPHWAGILPVLAGGALATVANSRNGRILAVLALTFWIVLAVVSSADFRNWTFVGTTAFGVSVALTVWATGVFLATFGKVPKLAALGFAMLWPALAAVLILLGIEQAATRPSINEPVVTILTIGGIAVATVLAAIAFLRKGLPAVNVAAIFLLGLAALAFALAVADDGMASRLVGGIIVLVAAFWAVNLGVTGFHGAGKTTGLAAFGLEIVYLYVVTIGTLIDTAFAFLLGGVLFIALAWALYRLDRFLVARAKAKGAPPPAADSEAKP